MTTTNEDLKKLILGLGEAQKGTNQKVCALSSIVKNGCESLVQEIASYRKQNELLQRKNEELEIKLATCENKLKKIENVHRKKNLLIYNVIDNDDSNRDLIGSVIQIFNEQNININENMIDNVWRIGNNQGQRPVIVRFLTNISKQKVFNKQKELKAAGFNIANDYAKEQRLQYKKLKETVIKGKKKGINCHIKSNKI